MSQISDGYPVKLTDRRREGGRGDGGGGDGGGGGRGGGGERQKKEGFSAEGTFTVRESFQLLWRAKSVTRRCP